MKRNKNDREQELLHYIWQTLKKDPNLNLYDVQLNIKDGILYINGEIDNSEMKRNLIELIHRIPYKIPIISHLTVKANKGLIGDMNDSVRMI